jgi:hypothetical protein
VKLVLAVARLDQEGAIGDEIGLMRKRAIIGWSSVGPSAAMPLATSCGKREISAFPALLHSNTAAAQAAATIVFLISPPRRALRLSA